MSLDAVVRYLSCPVCGARLDLGDGSLRCTDGHAFDIARQGYVNLTRGKPSHEGDSAAMLDAREAFLATGHYAPLAGAIAEAIARAAGRVPDDVCVADAGAGTGYYLAAALDATPNRTGIALDVSRYAARRAAKAHPRAGSVLCDVWSHLPLRDGCVGVLLNVFAPRNGSEMARVLHPDGTLVVVTPTTDHLRELVSHLGLIDVDAQKEERLTATLGPRFELIERRPVEFTARLSQADALALVAMGPSARHGDENARRTAVASLPDPLDTTVSVTVARYRPRPDR